jgi:hypothetical protein
MSGNISKLCNKTYLEPANMYSPLISYDSVTSHNDRLTKIKNLTMFYQDLNNNALPQWMFITPNMSSFSRDSKVRRGHD